ncbi:hypothetical protein [Heyndrickxia coagulans]|uniref:hypothetical protein n=1 Tax=Heyndrickxia coagulans TaxID=1398 RepID=UPI003D196A29
MGYFYISHSGGGGSIDLSSIEMAIINKGGTVTKAGDKATVEELLLGISTIPVDGYGVPIPSMAAENITFTDPIDITESHTITFTEASA